MKQNAIIYVITKLELGGAQKVCLSLFKQFESSDTFDVFLISGKDGKLVELVKDNNNVILLDNLKREISFLGIINEIRSFFRIIKEIKKIKNKYKEVLVHTHSTKAGIIGRWATFFAGVKNRVHTIHGYAFHDHQNFVAWLLAYIPELLTSFITTHFVCVSSKDSNTGKKIFPKFKNSIIRAAVEWDKFFIPAHKLETHPKNIFTFGTVACFKKQKNLFDLLNAFKEVYAKNTLCRLEIIGDGILRSDIEKWITKNKLEKAIILHGWQENVAQIMIDWDCFVLSSLWEGLPCAVVEARLLKLPVLSYDTGGISEIILNNKNGYLFKQKDWLSLAKGMLKISSDKNSYLNLKNFDEDLNDFNEKNMFIKHVALYNRIILK